MTAAVEAAVTLARDYGFRVDAARVLHRGNNTAVHLAPARVVAKIDTSNWTGRSGESLARELAVALHLGDRSAPAVRPASGVAPRIHVFDGFAMTLWDYVDVDLGEPDAAEAARALRNLHEGLATFEGALPSFEEFVRNVEWDLSALPAAAERAIPRDPERLTWFRRIRSICVAVWCAAEPRRAPEVAQAVDVHARVLRDEALA